MKRIHGVPGAPGYAIGPAILVRAESVQVQPRRVEAVAAELSRLEQAMAEVGQEMLATTQHARQELSEEAAAILEAQQLMLNDPELAASVRRTIEEEHLCAEFAVQRASEGFATRLDGLSDDYFRARAADVRDVARRLVQVLVGIQPVSFASLFAPGIIVAPDLTPSDTVRMDKRMVLGFCTAEGSSTSHTSILARALGIPAVVGAGQDVTGIAPGARLILDGGAGEILVDPPQPLLDEYRLRDRSLGAARGDASAHAAEPAITLDGRRVEVFANIGGVSEAQRALDAGAEGVGLLRTEFLYLEHPRLPDESEQVRAYSEILGAFGQRPVTLRTLDIGGDKSVPYLGLPAESNSFLGTRGLRLCLRRPDLFKPQLRAALRASAGHNLRIMFPMVAAIEEVERARQLLDGCRRDLERQGVRVADNIQTGIMVEVPSAAILAERFAPHVDFFSVGTNDLTQYTLAADRTNPSLSHLASAFSPAVLALINGVIRAAHAAGKWAGVCGELAGELVALPILLGMGLDEFSMNPPAIPLAKQTLRRLDSGLCADLAKRCLAEDDAQAVQSLVVETFPWLGAS